jgi:molybdopterin-containing oxidoreductase family iron-sulfur binding subunit
MEARRQMGTCAQCAPAPCEEACPAGAVSHNDQGVVVVDQELCLGCRFCVDACESGALLYVDPYSTATPARGVPGYTAGQPSGALPNTVAKCTLCSSKLLAGQLSVCAEACPPAAVWVGNLDRNTATNGRQLVRLSDLLDGRSFDVIQPGRRAIALN